MTDRELLEMAAKAAGITSVGYGRNGIATGRNGPCLVGYWNPLTDDGDALRLAVALRIVVDVTPWAAYAHRWNEKRSADYGIRHSEYDDLCAATRRAIVRAAAAIGSAM